MKLRGLQAKCKAKTLFFLFLTLFLGKVSLSQDPNDYLRSNYSVKIPVSIEPGSFLEVSENFSTNKAMLKWVKWNPTSNSINLLASLQLPFHYVGAACRVYSSSNTGGAQSFLLSGLEYVSWSPENRQSDLLLFRVKKVSSSNYSISITDSIVFSDKDIIGVYQNLLGKKLYLFDRNQREIYVANWNGEGSLLPQPASFSKRVDENQIPELGHLFGRGPEVSNPINLFSRRRKVGVDVYSINWMDRSWHIPQLSGGVTIDPQLSGLRLRNPFDLNNQDPIDFYCNSDLNATDWKVRRLLDGSILAQGSVQPNVWKQITSVSGEIVSFPGFSLQLKVMDGSSLKDQWVFEPFLEYGTPVSSTHVQPKGIGFFPGKCLPGSQQFGHQTDCKITQINSSANQVQVTLWTAFRGVNGDPISWQGNVAILAPQFTQSWVYNSTVHPSVVGVKVPIPNDPGLAGSVILWQYIFSYGNELAYTQVFGTTIQDPQFQGNNLNKNKSNHKSLQKYLNRIKRPTEAEYKKILHSLLAAPGNPFGMSTMDKNLKKKIKDLQEKMRNLAKK